VRAPSSTLVVDAAVLISVVFGRSTGAIAIKEVQLVSALITTDRVVHEARRRLELGLKRPELLKVLDDLAQQLLRSCRSRPWSRCLVHAKSRFVMP
jgi:hypothetical protein